MTSIQDTADKLIGLMPGSYLHSVRHDRPKVVDATQGSEACLFNPELPGLTLNERLFVAFYACSLTPNTALKNEYASRLKSLGESDAVIDAVSSNNLDRLSDSRLKALLVFTHILTLDPVRADKQALLKLKEAGLSTPEVVTLAQLIAFVSYQVRLISGVAAMKALEK